MSTGHPDKVRGWVNSVVAPSPFRVRNMGLAKIGDVKQNNLVNGPLQTFLRKQRAIVCYIDGGKKVNKKEVRYGF